MVKGAQALELPIVWNEQIPDKLGTTISELKELLPEMEPLVKTTFSCCGNESFADNLKSTGRKQVLLIGMETHVCVYQTALDLIAQEYEVYVVSNAVSSRTATDKEIGLQAMVAAGARITSVEMALFEMLGKAQGDQFRQVIKIVK